MSALERALGRALAVFEEPTEEAEREPGFEYPDLDESDRQLRKACRLLDLSRRLLHDPRMDHERHYTVAIETSFGAIERAIQAGLARAGRLEERHTRSHEDLLKDSHLIGLWDQDISGGLARLHHDHRSGVYYRDGMPSLSRAEALWWLADEVHRTIIAWNQFTADECICTA